MTIQDVIDKGYKPGMRIKCAASSEYTEGIVSPVEKWDTRGNGSVTVGCCEDGTNLFAYSHMMERWADIITPAPSKGLQEGDSVECSPAMRAAIIELAKELGVPTYGIGYNEPGVNALCADNHGLGIGPTTVVGVDGNITPEEFIARMRVTASIPKPETIDGCTVEYHAGYIKVGCTKVPNDVVLTIYQKLKD